MQARQKARSKLISDAYESSLPSFILRRKLPLRGSLDLGDSSVPIENLLTVPMQNAFVLVHVVVDLLEVLYPMRLSTNVGMNCQRADFRALRAFGVEAVKLIDRTLQQIVAFVMLDQHHRNVVEL